MMKYLLFGLLACTMVVGDIYFNVDYSDCFGDDEGKEPSVTFKSYKIRDGWSPLLIAVWRASPQYNASSPELPPRIYCHDLHIHVQGSIPSGMMVDCETDVSYAKGDSGDYSSMFSKMQQLYETCETTETHEQQKKM